MPYKKENIYLFFLPVLFFQFYFLVFPLVWLFSLSFFEVPINLKYTFVGLNNFVRALWDITFLNSLKNSIFFVGGSVIGQVGFGFLIAVLLNQKVVIGREFYRSLFLLPWLLSDVVIGTAFILLFSDYGTVNSILKGFGIMPPTWLTSFSLAMFVVTLANIWKSTSFYICLLSAGLINIPPDMYEAAQVDGASLLQRFRFITMPLMKPFLALSLLYSTITTYNYYGVIYVITYGGPLGATTVPAFLIYRIGLEWGELGYASAIGVFVLMINLFFLIIMIKMKLIGGESIE
ncbi:MAG: carbohydrate ABC transporter permease [Nitrososphaeria archaeon]